MKIRNEQPLQTDLVDLLSYSCGANFFLTVYHMLTIVPGGKRLTSEP